MIVGAHGKAERAGLRYFAAMMAIILAGGLLCGGADAAGLPGRDGKLVVARGIGWSPWHKTEHWGLSEETRALDERLLRQAHINTLRTWGTVSPDVMSARLEQGFYFIPTVHCHEGLKAQFPDGSEKNLALSDNGTRAKFVGRVEEYAGTLSGSPEPLCLLLGNEYSAVGYYKAIDNYQYTGFEEPTQKRFEGWLEERFGDIGTLNQHCGTDFAGFAEVKPVANQRIRYEWWLFLNGTFREFMRAAHNAVERASPDVLTSYAKLMGTHWDPYTEDARLSFLDVPGSNLYWHWVKDWAKYNAFIDDLIATGRGKPVIITEGGFQSRVLGRQRSARLTKQMLWNAFMHSRVAGFCVYAYSDEWYVDGNPEEQTDGESWGIVTADREPKPSYYAVAEVYEAIERLNDFFAHCRAELVVAVSNQALGYLVERKSIGLHYEIGRVLYSNGVPFKSIMPADVYELDADETPRLIFCDELFDCEPDGSNSALNAFWDYVEGGGEVLYLVPEPWQPVYGEAAVPEELQFGPDVAGVQHVKYGQGSIRFIPRNEFEYGELEELVLGFLAGTGAALQVSVEGVLPEERASDCFCRVLTAAGRRILILVNAGEEWLEEIELEVRNCASPEVLYGDGARLAEVEGDGHDAILRIQNLNTYALVEIASDKGMQQGAE